MCTVEYCCWHICPFISRNEWEKEYKWCEKQAHRHPRNIHWCVRVIKWNGPKSTVCLCVREWVSVVQPQKNWEQSMMVRPFFFTLLFVFNFCNNFWCGRMGEWMGCKMSKPQYWNGYDQIIKRSLFYNILLVGRGKKCIERTLQKQQLLLLLLLSTTRIHLAKASNASVKFCSTNNLVFSFPFSFTYFLFLHSVTFRDSVYWKQYFVNFEQYNISSKCLNFEEIQRNGCQRMRDHLCRIVKNF